MLINSHPDIYLFFVAQSQAPPLSDPRSNGNIKVVETLYVNAYGQATMRVGVYEQNSFAFSGKSDAEVKDCR